MASRQSSEGGGEEVKAVVKRKPAVLRNGDRGPRFDPCERVTGDMPSFSYCDVYKGI